MSAASEPPLIEEQDQLDEIVAVLRDQPAYALDTEFHRERTYYPKVALVQLAWDGGLVLVDPLAVDLAPLAEVLDGPGVAVLHAADQDLEVLDLACGTVPSILYDTQIAAGFLGLSTPSLSSVCERWMGVRLPKAERLTDWLARPLGPRQLDYAAADVLHLLAIREAQLAELDERGRVDWCETECELARNRRRGGRDPDEAWRRIKEARSLRGEARDIVRAVAAWRERRAAEIDQPPRFVLSDMGVVGIAQRAPSSPEALGKVRGVDDRLARGRLGREILDAVRAGREHPLPRDDGPRRELPRELRPAVSLVSAWVSQLAREESIDTTLVATRADIEALLRGDEEARLRQGWRAELVGEPIERLVSGDAALAFETGGDLVLEERSGRPLR